MDADSAIVRLNRIPMPAFATLMLFAVAVPGLLISPGPKWR